MPSMPPNVFSLLCKALQKQRTDSEDYPTKGRALNFHLDRDQCVGSPSARVQQPPSHLHEESKKAHEESKKAEEHSWSELQNLPLSRSPGSTVSTEACPDLDAAPFDLDEDVPEVLSATLDPAMGLCLREPCEPASEAAANGESCKLVRAERLELREGAGLRAIGAPSARSEQQELHGPADEVD
eukprot:CAMPEP_0171262954 /NCGR_PEP_ID=MMETSP0790-20130122/56837_1 /TAXON_ID=2925 /ORGANISM="Alexandrium catenella, Strain OF101" /LENGTH=183 /DNA_ID=CAMNT_0011731531 /DNA_START=24 /DNA_END=572 /DNA_ORIENTATION=+